MSKNSQILEKVGGLEAAQGIVDRAPGVFVNYYVTDGQYKGQYGNECGVFEYGFFDDTMTPFPPPHIKLSDLRTAIIEQREFALGLAPDDAYVKSAPFINIDDDFNPDSRHISPACHVNTLPALSHNEIKLMQRIDQLDDENRLMSWWIAALVVIAVVGWLV